MKYSNDNEINNHSYMKKILTILVLVLCTQLHFAQYFTLTPQGFVSANKSEYVVVDVPNTKQKDLYKSVLNALSTMYKDPKKVLSTVDGESISVKGYEENVIEHKFKGSPLQIGKLTLKYDLSYTISFLFKDNRIRIDRPSFELRRWYEGGYNSGWVSEWQYLPLNVNKNVKTAVFDKNGEINSELSYNGLNKHFNNLITEILEKSKKINDW
ncbi:hypothetical protein IW16_24675 [Chryseobacterium vrystaatense]|nr:hypothetical protein IW16_24675 [Chryseobacterium vrystaatense]